MNGINCRADRHGIMLLDLPASALLNVLSHVLDPAALEASCQLVRHVVTSSAFHFEWITRWHRNVGPKHRPLIYKLLTWRALRGSTAQELVQFIYRVLQQQQSCLDASEVDGKNMSVVLRQAADALRKKALAEALQLLAPFPQQLLCPFLALGGHAALLREVLLKMPVAQLRQAPVPGYEASQDVLLQTVLCAATAGHLEALIVLNQLHSFADMSDTDQARCLQAAAYSGQLACIQHVVKHTTHGLDAWMHRSSYLPLAGAAASGNVEAFNWVLSSCSYQQVSAQLQAAITQAGRAGHVEVLDKLLALPNLQAETVQVRV